MPRALVTGATGFVGPYLIRYLLELGYEVVGGVYGSIAALPEACRVVEVDVSEQKSVKDAIAENLPDEIYHLAGLTRSLEDDVQMLHRINFGGALNLLEAVRVEVPHAAVLMVSSAYVYGKRGRHVSETQLLEPVNHYGVSKAAADLLGYSYSLEGLRVVRVRPFNHSGPHQSPDFLLPALVKQFVEIQAGEREPVVRVGNLDSVRDFSDVRCIVRGYHHALSGGRSGQVYNLGSGQGTSVRRLYELVRQESGVDAGLRVDSTRERAKDIPNLTADVRKAYDELGWKTEIPLRQTIKDMLDSARDGPEMAEESEQ